MTIEEFKELATQPLGEKGAMALMVTAVGLFAGAAAALELEPVEAFKTILELA